MLWPHMPGVLQDCTSILQHSVCPDIFVLDADIIIKDLGHAPITPKTVVGISLCQQGSSYALALKTLPTVGACPKMVAMHDKMMQVIE